MCHRKDINHATINSSGFFLLKGRPPRGTLNENWTFICCPKKAHTLYIEEQAKLSMMDDIKKSCHTNVLCKNGIDSISVCCSSSTYKMAGFLRASGYGFCKTKSQVSIFIKSLHGSLWTQEKKCDRFQYSSQRIYKFCVSLRSKLCRWPIFFSISKLNCLFKCGQFF